MTKHTIGININGEPHELTVDPGERLIDVLRDRLGLTGTKEGCGRGECGACTINLNGEAVLACLMLAVQADGAEITTIEGLQSGISLHPLQKAFLDEAAVQCGYCTPGMIMAANALLSDHPRPHKGVIKECLANNLCRCTGYDRPIRAVLKAAKRIEEKKNG